MKRIINIIATTLMGLLSSLFMLVAQDTQPTPKTRPTIPTIQAGAKWQRLRRALYIVDLPDENNNPVFHREFYNSTETFLLDKVKEIDGKSYFDLGKTGNIENVYVREDLNEGKIYMYANFVDAHSKEPDVSTEVVLFDYSAKVGDTITVYSGYPGQDHISFIDQDLVHGYLEPFLLRVRAINTREILGKTRLVYSLERVFVKGSQHPISLETYDWIEGVGYSFGFLFNKDQLGVVPGFYFLDFKPLCYTSPQGDVYRFHPSALCEIKQTNRVAAPLASAPLDVQLIRDQLGLTVRVNDDKYHDLTIYRYDGTTLMGTISFSENYALALPHTTGEKVLIVVDDETIPYIL